MKSNWACNFYKALSCFTVQMWLPEFSEFSTVFWFYKLSWLCKYSWQYCFANKNLLNVLFLLVWLSWVSISHNKSCEFIPLFLFTTTHFIIHSQKNKHILLTQSSLHCTLSVSYTHLDVYKRQIVHLSKLSKSVYISFVDHFYGKYWKILCHPYTQMLL